MQVRFYKSGAGGEWVAISTGFDGRDEVHRLATPEDRHRFASEYAAFRPPSPEAPPALAGVIDTTPPKPAKKR